MRSTGDNRYTNRYPEKKGTAPLTHQLEKLKYRRGQGRGCDSLGVVLFLAWFPRSSSFTTKEMRVGLDQCQPISSITSSAGSWRMSTQPRPGPHPRFPPIVGARVCAPARPMYPLGPATSSYFIR